MKQHGMERSRRLRLLAVVALPVGLTTVLWPGAVSAATNKAIEVLRKAIMAQGEVTYSSVGTVTDAAGGQSKTSTQTVYRKQGGKERIKMQDADGETVWMRVCDGTTAWEQHLGSGRIFRRSLPPADRLRKRELFNLQMLSANFAVSLVGAETVAGRKAHHIRIASPGQPPVTVREVWIDQGKFVELRTRGYGPDGQLFHTVTLDRVNFAPTFDADTFRFEPPPGIKVHVVEPSKFIGPLQTAASHAGFPAILPREVPAGFALYRDLVGVREQRDVTVLWFQYTNGMRQFSIFERKVGPGDKEPGRGRGWTRTVRVGDFHFTIVGQLSADEFEIIKAGYQPPNR